MPKVLISDSLSPRALEVLQEAGIEVDVKIDLSESDLIAIIGGYDGNRDPFRHEAHRQGARSGAEAESDRPRRHRRR